MGGAQHKALLALAWLGVSAAALVGIVNMVDTILRDTAVDPVEGVVLSAQLGLQQGQPLYDPMGWKQAPLRINLYGPVFYHIGYWVMRLLGNRPTLMAGRLVSLIGIAVALSAAWHIARRHLRCGRDSCAIGLLAILAYAPVWSSAVLNRVDTLAGALSISGFALAIRGGRSLKACPLLFVLAVYTKATAIAAPAAVIAWLALERRWRELGWVAGVGLAVGTIWGVAEQRNSHGGFLTSTLWFNHNAWHLEGGIARIEGACASAVLPIAVGLATALTKSIRSAEGRVALYLLLAVAVACGTVGKVGAGENYFVEAGFALGLVVAWAWDRWDWHSGFAGIAGAVSCVMLVGNGNEVRREILERRQRDGLEGDVFAVLHNRYALTPEVTSLLRAGGRPVVTDPYIVARLAERNEIDQHPLVSAVAAGEVEVVLADGDLSDPGSSNRWTTATREAVIRNYRLTKVIGSHLFVYVPSRKE